MKAKLISISLVGVLFLGCVSKNLDVDTNKIKEHQKFTYKETLYIPYDKKSKKFIPKITNNNKILGVRLDNFNPINFKKVYLNCDKGFGNDTCNHCAKFGLFYEPDTSRTGGLNFITNLFMGAISLGILPVVAGFPESYDCKLNQKNIDYIVNNFLNKYRLNDEERKKILDLYNNEYKIINSNKEYFLKIANLLNINVNQQDVYNNMIYDINKQFPCKINECYNILSSNYTHLLGLLNSNKNVYNYLKNNGVNIETLEYVQNLSNSIFLTTIISKKLSYLETREKQLRLLSLKKQAKKYFQNKYKIRFSTIDISSISKKINFKRIIVDKKGFIVFGSKFNEYRIIKLDRNGKILWDNKFSHMFNGVVDINGNVYAYTYNEIYIFNGENGKLIKKINLKGDYRFSIDKPRQITSDIKYLFTVDGYLVKLKDLSIKLKRIIYNDNLGDIFISKNAIVATNDSVGDINIYFYNFKNLNTFYFNNYNYSYDGWINIGFINSTVEKPLIVFYNARKRLYYLFAGETYIGNINLENIMENYEDIVASEYIISPNEAFILNNKAIIYVYFNDNNLIYYKVINLPYDIRSDFSIYNIKENVIYTTTKDGTKILAIHLK